MKRNGWQFVNGTKETYWIDLYYFEEGEAWAKASVKWDGCIHFYTVANEPYVIGKEATESQCENYIHLCGGVDSFITLLRELEKKAKEHFSESGGWPRCASSESEIQTMPTMSCTSSRETMSGTRRLFHAARAQ